MFKKYNNYVQHPHTNVKFNGVATLVWVTNHVGILGNEQVSTPYLSPEPSRGLPQCKVTSQLVSCPWN